MSIYEEDLARIHDEGFTRFVRESMPGLERVLVERGIVGGTALDLGCGSGVWLARLIELGYEGVGVDVSPAMLRIARERAPGARLIEGSVFDVELPVCDAVTAISECFNYLGNNADADESLGALLGKIHRALRPGGVLIFDLALRGRVGAAGLHKHVVTDDWAIMVDSAEPEAGAALERRMTTFYKASEGYRRLDETHRLRLYEAEEIESAVRGAGFAIERVETYGAEVFGPGYGAFVATKG